MASQRTTSKRSIGWMGLQRGHRAKPLEWLAEKIILGVSLSSILMNFLIFIFIGREALPVALGRMNTALIQSVIPVNQLEKLSPQQLRDYLGLTKEQLASMDHDTLKTLMELKIEATNENSKDKDASVNSTQWRYLLGPKQWTGYPRPEYIWQPVSEIPKYNIVPLIIGSLKVTLVALLFAVPLALAAAIFVSQLARPRLREWAKPVIELLAGIPSVVLGFFALIVMASVLQRVFGYQSRLNALSAGLALGFSVIPVVFSIAEDALTSVPRSYVQAALALGASQWKGRPAGGFAGRFCRGSPWFRPRHRRDDGRPHGQRQRQHRFRQHLRFGADDYGNHCRRTGRGRFWQRSLSYSLSHRSAAVCGNFPDEPGG
jgi:phosphate transport system permease protein